MKSSRCASSVAFALVVLLASPVLRGAEPGVRDEAKFFSPEAVQQATSTLTDLNKSHGKQVVIETFPTIPANLQARFNSGDKARFYREWGFERAKELQVNGIYVQIVRQPGHLEVEVGKNTQQQGFSAADGQQLSNLMLQQFKSKQYDKALLDGVAFVQSRFAARQAGAGAGGTSRSDRANPLPGPAEDPSGGATVPPPVSRQSPAPRSAPSGGGGFPMGSILCIGAAVLIVVMLVRSARRLRGAGGSPGAGGYGGGVPPAGGGYYGGAGAGGGGFGRGLMGGLLGGVLGSWLGGRMTDHRSYGDTGPGPLGGGGTDSFGGTSSSGGDFDASSGSSFGDSGGSDFGGGGDFGGSSSSGGDF